MSDLNWPDDSVARAELMAEAARTGRNVRMRSGSIDCVMNWDGSSVYPYKGGGVTLDKCGYQFGTFLDSEKDILGWAEPEPSEQPDPDAAARAACEEYEGEGGSFDDLKPKYKQRWRDAIAAVRAVIEREIRAEAEEVIANIAQELTARGKLIAELERQLGEKPASEQPEPEPASGRLDDAICRLLRALVPKEYRPKTDAEIERLLDSIDNEPMSEQPPTDATKPEPEIGPSARPTIEDKTCDCGFHMREFAGNSDGESGWTCENCGATRIRIVLKRKEPPLVVQPPLGELNQARTDGWYIEGKAGSRMAVGYGLIVCETDDGGRAFVNRAFFSDLKFEPFLAAIAEADRRRKQC